MAIIYHIERFHSHDQHLCIDIGTKESVCVKKEFDSHSISLGHQHDRCLFVLGHQMMAPTMSCENTLYLAFGEQIISSTYVHLPFYTPSTCCQQDLMLLFQEGDRPAIITKVSKLWAELTRGFCVVTIKSCLKIESGKTLRLPSHGSGH